MKTSLWPPPWQREVIAEDRRALVQFIEGLAWAILILAVAALTSGCGGYFGDASTRATQAAVDVVDSPKYKKELDDMAAEAAGAARDKLLDADTSSKADALVGVVGLRARSELLSTTDAFLPKLHLEALSLRDDLLGPKTLEAADALRERIAGQPLRDDVDALLADATPKLAGAVQASLAPIKVTVDSETSKVERDVWIGLAIVFCVFVLYESVMHRKALERLAMPREVQK